LQYIYNEEIDDLKKSFLDLKKQTKDREFKFEVMLSFWFAIHMKKLQASKIMLE